MKKVIRIAVAEDHALVRAGIVHLLNSYSAFSVITDVENGAQLLNRLRAVTVDIVLLDLDMPVMDGRSTLMLINQRYPKIKVIILSMHHHPDYVIDCMSRGARGFVSKNYTIERVIDAIKTVYSYGYYFDDTISRALLQRIAQEKQTDPECAEKALSRREQEIVRCICEGMTNREIAQELSLSTRTVEVHRKHIAEKTHSSNMAGVIVYAIKNGFYEI